MTINIYLSLLSLLQAFYLVKTHQKDTSYRYFLYSLLLVFVNIPTLSEHYKILLIGIIIFKNITSSYKAEILDPVVFFINMAIVSYITFFIRPEQDSNIIALMLSVMLVIALLRLLMDKTLTSPIYILPVLILSSYFAGEQTIMLTILYSMIIYTVHLFDKKKITLFLLIAFLLPFIDSSIIYTGIQKLVMSVNDIKTESIFWVVIALAFLAITKFYEKNIHQAYKTFKGKQLFGIIPVIGISLGTCLYGYEFLQPIPLVAIIPIIVVEGRYLGFIKRTPLEQILSIITKSICQLYMFKLKILRKIKAFYDIVILRRTKNKKVIHKNLIYRAYTFTEELVFKKAKTEDLIAVICLVLITLILLLGDK